MENITSTDIDEGRPPALWDANPQPEPEDFVIATGKTCAVRAFCEAAFRCVDIELAWEGSGREEKGYDGATGRPLVEIDPRYFRPTEVDLLQGDATRAREKLGWTPRYTVEEMIEEMVESDLAEARDEQAVIANRNGLLGQ